MSWRSRSNVRSSGPVSGPEVRRALRSCSASAGTFLRGSAASLRTQTPPPALQAVEADFHAYIEEFGAVRHEGLTRDMGNEAAERFFALGFALEQMREHLGEVQRVVGEWAKDQS